MKAAFKAMTPATLNAMIGDGSALQVQTICCFCISHSSYPSSLLVLVLVLALPTKPHLLLACAVWLCALFPARLDVLTFTQPVGTLSYMPTGWISVEGLAGPAEVIGLRACAMSSS
eukprot:15278536-Heterocapsa_arctica.AAC.1